MGGWWGKTPGGHLGWGDSGWQPCASHAPFPPLHVVHLPPQVPEALLPFPLQAVVALMEMGFDEHEVVDALRVNNNQQNAAVSIRPGGLPEQLAPISPWSCTSWCLAGCSSGRGGSWGVGLQGFPHILAQTAGGLMGEGVGALWWGERVGRGSPSFLALRIIRCERLLLWIWKEAHNRQRWDSLPHTVLTAPYLGGMNKCQASSGRVGLLVVGTPNRQPFRLGGRGACRAA